MFACRTTEGILCLVSQLGQNIYIVDLIQSHLASVFIEIGFYKQRGFVGCITIIVGFHAYVFPECMQFNSSSSARGYVKKLQFEKEVPQIAIYYNCIQRCKETPGCVAVNFKNNVNFCWLKSSVGHVSRKGFAFVRLDCLLLPDVNVYQEFSSEMEQVLSHKCPDDFEDWVPGSKYCFKIFTVHQVNYFHAQVTCQDFYGGKLADINTEITNNLFAEMLRKLNHTQPIWIGWRWGISIDLFILLLKITFFKSNIISFYRKSRREIHFW